MSDKIEDAAKTTGVTNQSTSVNTESQAAVIETTDQQASVISNEASKAIKEVNSDLHEDTLVEEGEEYMIMEGKMKSNEGDLMYTRTWKPKSRPKAIVVFVHGHAEHAGRYDSLFPSFAAKDIFVKSFDQTGHGKTGKWTNSLGQGKGLLRLVNDIDQIIEQVMAEHKGLKVILMGHSWGGASVLNYLALGKNRNSIYGSIISSPALRISKESALNPLLVMLMKQAVKIFPTMKMSLDIDIGVISRDKNEVDEYVKDPYLFDRLELRQAHDIFVEGPNLVDFRYKDIQVPRLLIVHGTDDKLTDYYGTVELVDKLQKLNTIPDIKFMPYKGGYHELHKDLDREQVKEDYLNWIQAALDGINQSSPAPSMISKL